MKKNYLILHKFINNFQTTEIHEFDKQLPVMVKSYQALHHRTLKLLRTFQEAFSSVQTQVLTVAA